MLAVPRPTRANLPTQIRLLVGQRAAAEHRDRIVPVSGLNPVEGVRDAIERRIPARRTELAVRAAYQRLAQPVGMRERGGGRPSLHAEASAVHGKPRVAVDDDRAVLARKMHSALQRAVRAVRGRRRRHVYARREQAVCPAPLPSDSRGILSVSTNVSLTRELQQRQRARVNRHECRLSPGAEATNMSVDRDRRTRRATNSFRFSPAEAGRYA